MAQAKISNKRKNLLIWTPNAANLPKRKPNSAAQGVQYNSRGREFSGIGPVCAN
jgi:hypothetical protein